MMQASITARILPCFSPDAVLVQRCRVVVGGGNTSSCLGPRPLVVPAAGWPRRLPGLRPDAAACIQTPRQAAPGLAPPGAVAHQRLVVVHLYATRLHLRLHFHTLPPCAVMTPAASPVRRCARPGCVAPPGHHSGMPPKWGAAERIPAGSAANLIFS
jgi:hypothetical protein